uniref:Uncharacterized protein n=1 Tax=Leersia perrieri TaxID=77586 RepID=A0A0D9XJ33_9ORYZ
MACQRVCILLVLAALCALAAFPTPASPDSRPPPPPTSPEEMKRETSTFKPTAQSPTQEMIGQSSNGAKVKVECRSKSTGAKTCSFEGETDHTGTYSIPVNDEHEHELCESVLVSSPAEAKCGKVVAGRERAPVFLTNNNGVTSNVRLANALGFQKDTALAACAEILKMYEEVDDRV